MKTNKTILPVSMLAVTCLTTHWAHSENEPPTLEKPSVTIPSVKGIVKFERADTPRAVPVAPQFTIAKTKDLDAAYARRIATLRAELAKLQVQMVELKKAQEIQRRKAKEIEAEFHPLPDPPRIKQLKDKANLTTKRIYELQTAYARVAKARAAQSKNAGITFYRLPANGRGQWVPVPHDSKNSPAVPVLGNLPVVGKLFSEPIYYIGVTTKAIQPDGVKITNVLDDSPANRAGIKANDIILSCNGIQLSKPKDLVSIIQIASDQQALTFKITNEEGPARIIKLTPAKRETKPQGAAIPQVSGYPAKPVQPSPPRAIPAPRATWISPPKPVDPDLRKKVRVLEAEVLKRKKQHLEFRHADLQNQKKELEEIKKQLKQQQEQMQQLMKSMQKMMEKKNS